MNSPKARNLHSLLSQGEDGDGRCSLTVPCRVHPLPEKVDTKHQWISDQTTLNYFRRQLLPCTRQLETRNESCRKRKVFWRLTGLGAACSWNRFQVFSCKSLHVIYVILIFSDLYFENVFYSNSYLSWLFPHFLFCLGQIHQSTNNKFRIVNDIPRGLNQKQQVTTE